MKNTNHYVIFYIILNFYFFQMKKYIFYFKIHLYYNIHLFNNRIYEKYIINIKNILFV